MTEPTLVFAALADPSRCRVLELIAQHGSVSASELAGELTISRQAILKHLKILDHSGLVASHREGRLVVFSVTPVPLREAAAWLADRAAMWDRQLRLLKHAAESPDEETDR